MTNDIVLNATLRKNINVINRTVKAFEITSARLATGKKVNSALDNPQNFFAALELNNRAADFNRRLDGIGQSISTIQKADIGVQAIENLIDQGEAIAINSLEKAQAGEIDPLLIDVEQDYAPPILRDQILADGADIYYPLDNAGLAPVDIGNAGANNGGNYLGTVGTQADPIYSNGSTFSAELNGVNDRIRIASNALINIGDRPEKTVELVFQADDVTNRQVLYEEGGLGININVYIDDGQLYVLARANAVFGDDTPRFMSVPVEADQVNHVAFTYSSTDNNFEGFLNGQSMGQIEVNNLDLPNHNGGVGVGHSNGGAHYHDGFQNGAILNPFDGRISDVAFYNTALTQPQLQSHSDSLVVIFQENSEYNTILSQIDQIVKDSAYRGTNLLNSDDLTTFFDDDRSSLLTSEGVTFTSAGLGLENLGFETEEGIREILAQIRTARTAVRQFGTNLANDLNVLQTREDFTISLINKHNKGADKLILADQNEEGAKQLANSTRLQLATTALATATQQTAGIVSLISQSLGR